MQSSTLPHSHDRVAPGPVDHSEAPDHVFSDDDIPCAPDYWTLEDFRDILPGSIQ